MPPKRRGGARGRGGRAGRGRGGGTQASPPRRRSTRGKHVHVHETVHTERYEHNLRNRDVTGATRIVEREITESESEQETPAERRERVVRSAAVALQAAGLRGRARRASTVADTAASLSAAAGGSPVRRTRGRSSDASDADDSSGDDGGSETGGGGAGAGAGSATARAGGRRGASPAATSRRATTAATASARRGRASHALTPRGRSYASSEHRAAAVAASSAAAAAAARDARESAANGNSSGASASESASEEGSDSNSDSDAEGQASVRRSPGRMRRRATPPPRSGRALMTPPRTWGGPGATATDKTPSHPWYTRLSATINRYKGRPSGGRGGSSGALGSVGRWLWSRRAVSEEEDGGDDDDDDRVGAIDGVSSTEADDSDDDGSASALSKASSAKGERVAYHEVALVSGGGVRKTRSGVFGKRCFTAVLPTLLAVATMMLLAWLFFVAGSLVPPLSGASITDRATQRAASGTTGLGGDESCGCSAVVDHLSQASAAAQKAVDARLREHEHAVEATIKDTRSDVERLAIVVERLSSDVKATRGAGQGMVDRADALEKAVEEYRVRTLELGTRVSESENKAEERIAGVASQVASAREDSARAVADLATRLTKEVAGLREALSVIESMATENARRLGDLPDASGERRSYQALLADMQRQLMDEIEKAKAEARGSAESSLQDSMQTLEARSHTYVKDAVAAVRSEQREQRVDLEAVIEEVRSIAVRAAEFPTVPLEDTTSGYLTPGEVRHMIRGALEVFAADRISKRDFAAVGAGAVIERGDGLTSDTFVVPSHYPLLEGALRLVWPFMEATTQPPEEVIEPDTNVGSCWPMQGNHGYVTVRLVAPIVPSSFTIDHPARDVLLDWTSAPKLCQVLGLRSTDDPSPTVLAEFTYDIDGAQVQTFERNHANMDSTAYPLLQLKVLDNYGHPDYTCVYRFRVHGALDGSAHLPCDHEDV